MSKALLFKNFLRCRPVVRFQTSITATQSNSNSFQIDSNEEFNERVKNSKVPVIVDFFATWCNPCRMLTPQLETVIAEKNGKVVLAKVDIDKLSDLALDYDIGAVPVLVAIKDGKVEDRLVGLQDSENLRKFVEKVTQSEK